MKDNMPNYLNYHGIDPGRVEPARVDRAPGFDSIRPGMNKCGMLNAECEMREGAPFDEYGMQIALAGGDWSKGIQDHAERNGPFLSDSRLRHFVRHEQPPTMSNAEAIEVLKGIETDIYGKIAIVKAIDVLSFNDKLITACKNLIRDSSPFEPDKALCNVLDIRRLLAEVGK